MKLTVTTFLSVDGVMQGPGGPDEDRSGGFDRGGWLVPHFDEELGEFMDGVFQRADALLLGRGTYEIFAGSWGQMDEVESPVSVGMNRLPKHVASTTLDTVEWENSRLIEGDVAEAVAALKQSGDGELQVHGSAGLAAYLADHGLVDEYNLITFPVILGNGKRLFGAGAQPTGLAPVSQRTTGTGVRIDVWRTTGEPEVGTAEVS
jgi:dihydrofolate reductase